MRYTSADVKSGAEAIKVSLGKVVEAKQKLQDYQNTILEFYNDLEYVEGMVDEDNRDEYNQLFERVSEIVSMEESVYFDNGSEQEAKDLIEILNTIAESGGVKDEEEEE